MWKYRDINTFVKTRSKSNILLIAVVITIFLGYIDYLTGFELRIDVFYLIPIAVVVWHVSNKAGLFTSLLSVLLIFISDLLSKPVHVAHFIDIWNIVMVLFFFIIFTLSLSRLRVALDKQRQLSSELQNALVDIKKTNESLEAFSYSVSHDLKGPLWHITGFAEMISEKHADKFDEAGKKYIHRIISNAHRMRDYIDALLKLSQYSKGDLVRSTIDLTTMVRGILEESENNQSKSKAELIIADNITAYGDAALIQVVIHNLIENALKFTKQRSAARIEFGTTKIDGKIVYFIRDNGVGFRTENAKRLFSPFKRDHSDSEYPGYGIGLATVQRIIHRHGGRIWAESEMNVGPTFYFTLG